jgi:O-antigen/teichoic acid export membrane protein
MDTSTSLLHTSAPEIGRAASRLKAYEQSLLASVGYSLSGQVIYLATQWGILSGLAHFHGPTAVGEFGLALALSTPLFLLSNGGFRNAQASDVSEQYSFAEYGGARILLTALAVALTLALGYVFSSNRTTMLVIAVVAASKVFESVSNLAYGAFQQAGRMDLVAASLVTRGSLTLGLFLALLFIGASAAVALLAQVLVWSAVGLLVDYPRASRLVGGRVVVVPRWTGKRSWRLIAGQAPLGGGILANSLQVSVPRILIERYLGLEALGLFTVVDYLLQASVIASNSVSHALLNRFARLAQSNQRQRLKKLVFKLFFLFGGAGLGAIAVAYWIGEDILALLFGRQYASTAPLLLVMSVVISIRMLSVLPQTVLMAERRFSLFLLLQVIGLALTALGGLIAIPAYGLIGAGYLLVVTALFRLVFLEMVATRVRAKASATAMSGENPETQIPL